MINANGCTTLEMKIPNMWCNWSGFLCAQNQKITKIRLNDDKAMNDKSLIIFFVDLMLSPFDTKIIWTFSCHFKCRSFVHIKNNRQNEHSINLFICMRFSDISLSICIGFGVFSGQIPWDGTNLWLAARIHIQRNQPPINASLIQLNHNCLT